MAESQIVDELLVFFFGLVLEDTKQFATTTNGLQEPATTMLVFGMCLEVIGQLGDLLSQNRDLHRNRAGIFFVSLISADDLFLGFVFGHGRGRNDMISEMLGLCSRIVFQKLCGMTRANHRERIDPNQAIRGKKCIRDYEIGLHKSPKAFKI